ncbi:MAG: hypothetical protein D6702_09665 [Planctomycetota bacterium]|nr:MAG: hypothetical protein D6702_09665 [Planctomycetota bacterium]
MLLLSLLPACSGASEPGSLRLLDWPGRDGRPVALDAPLRLEFDRPLASGLRRGAWSLSAEDGREARVRAEVAGRFLVLHPALPCRPDLEDAGLAPGRAWRLELVGLPRLAAVGAADGSILERTVRLVFRTAAADDPAALAGSAAGPEELRLLSLGAAGRNLEVRADGTVVLDLSGPVDPRTLAPAELTPPAGSGPSRQVPLELIENRRDGSRLRLRVGLWSGWRRLELPDRLEGIGGRPLRPADRRLGLRGAG